MMCVGGMRADSELMDIMCIYDLELGGWSTKSLCTDDDSAYKRGRCSGH
jgi:hypothetical protein